MFPKCPTKTSAAPRDDAKKDFEISYYEKEISGCILYTTRESRVECPGIIFVSLPSVRSDMKSDMLFASARSASRQATLAAYSEVLVARSQGRNRGFLPLLTLAIFVTTISCDTQQYTGAVADFGTACATVVEQTRNGYNLVNDTVLQQQVLALAVKASPTMTDPRKAFRPFLSEEDLTIRNKMLDGIRGYAVALGNLTGKTSSALDSETSKLAASLEELAKNDRLQKSFKETKSISAETTNAAAAGLDAIGKFMIDRKLRARLPAILADTEPKLESVVKLLASEIGDVPSSIEPGGLREKLWRTYDSLIESQTAIVDSDRPSSSERRQDVASLAALVRAQRNGDAALAGTRSALGKLTAAHKALLRVGAAPATFKVVFADLLAEAKDVQEFYSKLPNK
jgi:hypothetical protein